MADRLGLMVEARWRARPDGELLTWRAAGLDVAPADATMPFFMQWDRADRYPGAMRAVHANGARRVTSLTLTPSDAGRFEQWTSRADVPLRVETDRSPGLWSVGVETDNGELVIR